MSSTDSPKQRNKHVRGVRCENVCVRCEAYDRILPLAFLGGVVIALIYVFLFSAPRDLRVPTIVRVDDGASSGEIAQAFEDQHIVRSAFMLKLLLRALGGEHHIKAGSYFFPGPQNLITVAWRLRTSDFELNPVRIYIPEGMSVRDIGEMLGDKLAPFDSEAFVALATSSEGYLYPDTYFFFPGDKPDIVLKAMKDNFVKHVSAVQPYIDAFNKPEKDIVVMASILVGEARTDTDRRMVAGILWKRIQKGMPLQVDAPFGYVLDKKLTDLTSQDLKVNSPYNTYTNKGLPPTPINNPGMEAIQAAATPIKSNYLYYLSDKNGVMHYSVTFAEHEQQIQEYLK